MSTNVTHLPPSWATYKDRNHPAAESWNVAHPVGTRVRYWPVVVLINGKSGGVCLSHVEVLP